MWVKTALMLCVGFAFSLGNAGAEDHNLPPGIWQDLDKVHVGKFVADGDARSKVIMKINQALHEAASDTKIDISFVPPDLPEIDEAKYARSIHINVHDCTIADLLEIVARYDVDWKVKGNKMVGMQSRAY